MFNCRVTALVVRTSYLIFWGSAKIRPILLRSSCGEPSHRRASGSSPGNAAQSHSSLLRLLLGRGVAKDPEMNLSEKLNYWSEAGIEPLGRSCSQLISACLPPNSAPSVA